MIVGVPKVQPNTVRSNRSSGRCKVCPRRADKNKFFLVVFVTNSRVRIACKIYVKTVWREGRKSQVMMASKVTVYLLKL